MKQFANQFINGLLDMVYPPFCLTCGCAGEDYLCAKCIEDIDLIGSAHCLTCGTPTEQLQCSDCKVRDYAFSRAASVGVYDGVLKKAIHELKYNSRLALADPLADLLARCFLDTRLAGGIDLVIPIPIHRTRVLERGFNQSEELAARFCKKKSLPIATNVLSKTQKTRHQADLPQDQRYINVQGVLEVANKPIIAGKRVLLIDDVFTTGSTLNEAAKVLIEAGAASVCAYTLARSI